MRRASCLSRPTDICNTDRPLSTFTDRGSHSVLPPRPDILQPFIAIDSALPVLLTHLPAFTAECVHCRYSPTDNDCPQDTFVSARVYFSSVHGSTHFSTSLLFCPRPSLSVYGTPHGRGSSGAPVRNILPCSLRWQITGCLPEKWRLCGKVRA